MPQQDARDFVSAFAVGALVGAGAALLLRPDPPARRKRILRELEPHRREIGKRARHARRSYEESAAATAEVGAALRDAGREFLDDVRAELTAMVEDARRDLVRGVEARLDGIGSVRRRKPLRVIGR